jgi:mannitol/fructose-specific phosphotransferase system IIA component (Ntr-type)
MLMTHFVVRDAIIPALAATTRDEVIREMVLALHIAAPFETENVEEVVKAVIRRETLGSTGIGRNIAIPHTRHATVSRLSGTVAVTRNAVPFDSIDNEPVNIFVLLVSPQDQPGPHLRALESVVQTMRDDALVAALKAAETKDQIWDLLNGVAQAR